MAQDIKLIVFPAKDLEKTKTLLNKFLAAEPYADTPYYVGYKAGELEIGIDPQGQVVIAYTDVDNIEVSLKDLEKAGAMVHQEPKDVGGGLLIAQIKDANGNILGLRQAPSK